MSIDVEYAIKQDIRNNPVVRDIDRAQRREFGRALGVGALIVGMLLFSAWQQYRIVRSGYEIERRRAELAAAQTLNRHLRVQLETQLSPQRIDERARALGMVAPGPGETVILERARPAESPRAVVAGVR